MNECAHEGSEAVTSRQPRPSFNVRAFASVGMACAGLGLPVTGWATHALQFEPMTVARHAWMTAHNSFAVLLRFFPHPSAAGRRGYSP